MCYTIYLLHLAFAEFFVLIYQRIAPDVSFPAKLAIGLLFFLPALFIISSVFFLLVEKPCMDPAWPKKLKAWTLTILQSRK